MFRWTVLMPVALIAALAAACSESAPAGASSSGAPGEDGAAPVAPATDAGTFVPSDAGIGDQDGATGGDAAIDDAGDAGWTSPCGPGVPDLVGVGADNSVGVIRGTLTLPAPMSPSAIEVRYQTYNPSYSTVGLAARAPRLFLPEKTAITYEIRGVDPKFGGTVTLFARSLDNTLGGMYAGAAGASLPPWQATTINLKATPVVCNADFGIGPLICYRDVGEACAIDDECRSAKCQCVQAVTFSSRAGACDPATNTCQRAPNFSCAAKCAAYGGVKADTIGNCTDSL